MVERHIAILIDGGFFLKRLPRLVTKSRCATAGNIAAYLRLLCRNHVRLLTGEKSDRWHKHIYRIFYYDADPYDGQAHHPLANRQIDFGKSDLALRQRSLFEELRKQRNVALRLGKVIRDGDWSIIGSHSRKIISTKAWIESIDVAALEADGTIRLSPKQIQEMTRLRRIWSEIETGHVRLALRQKGVDMRIGLDIASLTLKKQVQTIVLVAGDSDFVPAAKLARREGVQFILDPLWQSVNLDLFEHIDGLQSGLRKPAATAGEDASATTLEVQEEMVDA